MKSTKIGGDVNKKIPFNKDLQSNRIIKKCEICGKEKSLTKGYLKYRPGRFCSAKCRNMWFSQMPIKIFCIECEKEFFISSGSKIKFCSHQCYWNNLKKRYKGRHGNNYKTTMSFGRKTYEHRAIIENKIRRKLNKKEIVHHINGDMFDNRIENLKLMTQSEHIKLHLNIKKH